MERIPGKWERLAAERHARDLALSLQPGGHPRGFVYDEAAGERVVQFVEKMCRHHKGEWAGQPLLLEPFQKDQTRQIFGWKKANGLRRFRTAYIEEPRKNGKSEKAGGFGLYLAVADGEPGAEVYSSATKKEQARIVWETAREMVKSSPELRRFVKIYQSSLACERMNSKFCPLSSDDKTLDGLNPHGNIVDELHAHKDRGVWDVLDTAMGARRQPLTIAITTAGTFSPESIGWQIHDYATKVLEGIVEDDSFFAVIYAADTPEDPSSDYYFTEAAQRQANPNYGVSVKPDYLATQASKARSQAGFRNEYLRLHLNVWTEAHLRWLSMEHWAQCEAPAPTASVQEPARPTARMLAIAREKELEGRACFGGLDLSTVLDLSALALLFPRQGSDELDAVLRFWMPEATIAKYASQGHKHFRQWADEGWITVVPGEVIDQKWIEAEVVKARDRYKLKEVAFDKWNASQVGINLGAENITIVECPQGFKTLSEPSKTLEARVIKHQFHHMNNPVLRFCASSAMVITDPAGNIKPDKSASTSRIDGLIASVMALSRIITQPKEAPGAYANGQGFRQL